MPRRAKRPSEMTDKQLAEKLFGKDLKRELDKIAHEKEQPKKPGKNRKLKSS